MTPIDVCCAIIEETHHGESFVWAARKDRTSHLAGLWEFPGGKIEPGESGEEAIMREIAEELGITVSVSSTLPPCPHDYGTHRIILHPFICKITGDQLPHPHDHEALALMKTTSLSSLPWAPADIPVLQSYLSRQC